MESRKVDVEGVASLLKAHDNIVLLCHQYPDGDTLGSAGALCGALQKMQKHVQIRCADKIGRKYRFMMEGLRQEVVDPAYIVSVDVADEALLGSLRKEFGGKIDLCIDHHGSNVQYAKKILVDSTAAATCEIIYDIIRAMGVEMDRQMANCIYTGITTDTGCFRYTNATPRTYRIAASMMELGACAADINRVMFDTKSRARIEIERMVMESMTFYFDGRCAAILITREMVETSGAKESDMEGLAALPRQVEGVEAGITLRERKDGAFKISLRTLPGIDASAICARFGGGGHAAAAGCTLEGPAELARDKVVAAVGDWFAQMEGTEAQQEN